MNKLNVLFASFFVFFLVKNATAQNLQLNAPVQHAQNLNQGFIGDIFLFQNSTYTLGRFSQLDSNVSLYKVTLDSVEKIPTPGGTWDKNYSYLNEVTKQDSFVFVLKRNPLHHWKDSIVYMYNGITWDSINPQKEPNLFTIFGLYFKNDTVFTLQNPFLQGDYSVCFYNLTTHQKGELFTVSDSLFGLTIFTENNVVKVAALGPSRQTVHIFDASGSSVLPFVPLKLTTGFNPFSPCVMQLRENGPLYLYEKFQDTDTVFGEKISHIIPTAVAPIFTTSNWVVGDYKNMWPGVVPIKGDSIDYFLINNSTGTHVENSLGTFFSFDGTSFDSISNLAVHSIGYRSNYWDKQLSGVLVDSGIFVPNKIVDSCNNMITFIPYTKSELAPTYIPQNTISSDIQVYPNPTHKFFSIKNSKNVRFTVYNVMGEVVKRNFYTNFGDVGDLPAGLYFIHIENHIYKIYKN